MTNKAFIEIYIDSECLHLNLFIFFQSKFQIPWSQKFWKIFWEIFYIFLLLIRSERVFQILFSHLWSLSLTLESSLLLASIVFGLNIRNVLFFGPEKCLKEFKSRVVVASKRRFWFTLISLRKLWSRVKKRFWSLKIFWPWKFFEWKKI